VRWGVLVWFVATAVCVAGCDLAVPPNVDGDNDLRRNTEDNCPTVANPDQSDFDRDGTGDACDSCDDGGDIDADADGIPDGCDGCIGNGEDADKDNIPDNCDGCIESYEDMDNDQIDDACDVCVGNGVDADNDGIPDNCDACIETHVDFDGDGIDDGCDDCIASGIDSDADGVDNNCDPCNAGPQHDEDGDSLFDGCDNCAAVSNPDQQNFAEPNLATDAIGDACDGDSAFNIEMFDSFARQNPAWYVVGSGWLVSNDRLQFVGGAAAYRILGTGLTQFHVTTQAHSVGTVQAGTYGIFLANDFPLPESIRVECQVTISGGGAGLALRVWRNGGFQEINAVGALNPATVELHLEVNEAKLSLTCADLKSNVVVSSTVETTGVAWLPGLTVTDTAVEFDFFDVITREQ
jgi:hypothetical protein